MPHDPELVAETRAWIVKASRDLRAAGLGARDPDLRGDALFHCQQAAEKSLKALLTWSGCTFRKTHSIGELGHAVVEVAPGLESILREAAELTDYAWKYRYPGDVVEPTEEEVLQGLTLARNVYDAILLEFPGEVVP